MNKITAMSQEERQAKRVAEAGAKLARLCPEDKVRAAAAKAFGVSDHA